MRSRHDPIIMSATASEVYFIDEISFAACSMDSLGYTILCLDASHKSIIWSRPARSPNRDTMKRAGTPNAGSEAVA